MLLQRLREYADRQTDLAPPLYAEKLVRYEVALNHGGEPRGLIELSGVERRGQNAGMRMMAPDVIRAGAAVKPCLITDTGEYALGWSDRADKAERYHAAFVDLIRECAEATGEPALGALLRYFENEAGSLSMPEGFDRASIVTFSVDGRYPTDIPTVRQFWIERASDLVGDQDNPPQCLVCGRRKPAVRIMPQKIKGIPGGQSSGTALISTNENAFESYGLDDVSCAPICIECAESVGKGLNKLLADERSRMRVSPLVYVYWTRADSALNFGALLTEASAEQVGRLLQAVRNGERGALGIPGDEFYCLGLGPSGGRVAVRDWIDTSIERVEHNLARYFQLQEIVEPWGSDERHYFPLWRLTRATLRSNAKGTDSPDPNIPRALMRCALLGGPLPDWLLSQLIKRLRAEQDVNHVRAALVKMVLASQQEGFIETMAGLDEENRDSAYLCGRLLAVLDQIQRAALGQRNATIIDRYFGTASTAPLSVFPRLTRGAQPHLGKLRRERPGVGRALENRMQEICDLLEGFPPTLPLRQQGMFVLGYYHQRAADRRAAIDRRQATTNAEEEIDQEG